MGFGRPAGQPGPALALAHPHRSYANLRKRTHRPSPFGNRVLCSVRLGSFGNPAEPLPLRGHRQAFFSMPIRRVFPRMRNPADANCSDRFRHMAATSPGAVPCPHPDLAWARMQLFATKFEYSASFHVFVSSLRNGSSLRVAERNAFNRDPDHLEKEAAANLQSGHWKRSAVSGRPLDPKRDLGEHCHSRSRR